MYGSLGVGGGGERMVHVGRKREVMYVRDMKDA